MRRSYMTSLAVATWALAVTAGLAGLHSYEATPGNPGVPYPRWPDGDRIRPVPGLPNLVLFAHPECPCTRASLGELARILEARSSDLAVHVVFFRPAASPEPLRPTGLRSRAATLPGVRIHDDPDGAEAARFGAATSGHLALYDRSGVLVYSGGITPARGRVGENPGRDAVIACLSGGPPVGAGAPVFGCPILVTPRTAIGGRLDAR